MIDSDRTKRCLDVLGASATSDHPSGCLQLPSLGRWYTSYDWGQARLRNESALMRMLSFQGLAWLSLDGGVSSNIVKVEIIFSSVSRNSLME